MTINKVVKNGLKFKFIPIGIIIKSTDIKNNKIFKKLFRKSFRLKSSGYTHSNY